MEEGKKPEEEPSSPSSYPPQPQAAPQLGIQPIVMGPQFGFPPGIPASLLVGISQQSWQGPYPPPEAAERFEALHPGFLSQVLAMAEREQNARIVAGERGQTYLQADISRGHWLGAACVGIPVLAVALALVQTYRQNAVVPTAPVQAQPQVPSVTPTPAPSSSNAQNNEGDRKPRGGPAARAE